MTKELAIKILSGDVLGTSEQTHEAIKMAIKGLEAEPVRHGKWRKVDYQIFVGKGAFVDALECSVCEEPNYEMSNYCPRCGAKMEGVKE